MLLAPGQCRDGSGNWLPLTDQSGMLVPVCPSDPLWPVALRAHGLGLDDSGGWSANPCGGAKWRTLSDDTVEVEGDGVPAYTPGTASFKMLEQTWANWAPEFRKAAKLRDVPASWLLAIATQETGAWASNPERQRTIVSGDGFGSIGITQPLAAFARQQGYTAEDRYDPFKNIDMAAIWAAKNVAKYGPELPLIAASHNAGSPRCSPGRNRWNMIVTDDYVGNVIKFNNAAIEYLDLKTGVSMAKIFGGGMLAVGLATAAYIAFVPKHQQLAFR